MLYIPIAFFWHYAIVKDLRSAYQDGMLCWEIPIEH